MKLGNVMGVNASKQAGSRPREFGGVGPTNALGQQVCIPSTSIFHMTFP